MIPLPLLVNCSQKLAFSGESKVVFFQVLLVNEKGEKIQIHTVCLDPFFFFFFNCVCGVFCPMMKIRVVNVRVLCVRLFILLSALSQFQLGTLQGVSKNVPIEPDGFSCTGYPPNLLFVCLFIQSVHILGIKTTSVVTVRITFGFSLTCR